MHVHNGRIAQWRVGDCRETLKLWAAAGIRARTCVTSPPYFGLRDYGHEGQLGLEQTPEAYVAAMVEVFRGVRDVLHDDGTLWLNIGDSYAGSGRGGHPGVSSTLQGSAEYQDASLVKRSRHEVSSQQRIAATTNTGARNRGADLKSKDLIGIPWMLAFALRADGWYLRQEIIWHKPNPMPESVRDRCTKAHESLFLFGKSDRYYFDSEAMQEPCVGDPKSLARARVLDTRGEQSGTAAYLGSPQRDKVGGFPTRGRAAGNKTHKYVSEYEAGDSELHRTKAGLLKSADTVYETRNRRSVWSVGSRPYKGAHFATFPPALIEPCVLAGSAPGDIVIDPFGGSGTTAGVALKHGRNAMLCELNAEYAALMPDRIRSIVS